MRYAVLLLVFVVVIGCSLFGPVTVGRRFVDLPARSEPCAVEFVTAPPEEKNAALIGELAIDATDPAPDAWQEEVRRKACGIGADSVYVTPITERRDDWTYCGGRDSLCRERHLIRYLGTALAYRFRVPVKDPHPGVSVLPTPKAPAPDVAESPN